MPDYNAPYEIHRLELLRRLIPERDGGTAVDIGCNDGTVAHLVAERGYDVMGVDLDGDLVAKAQRNHPDLTFTVGTVTDTIGVPRDLTTCLEVIEHISPSEQPGFVAQLAASIQRGGLLLMSTPGKHSFFSYYDRWHRRLWRSYDWWDPTHVGVISWRQLRRLLAPSFRIVSLTGYYYLPQERAQPLAISRWPLSTAGFDLIVMARRR